MGSQLWGPGGLHLGFPRPRNFSTWFFQDVGSQFLATWSLLALGGLPKPRHGILLGHDFQDVKSQFWDVHGVGFPKPGNFLDMIFRT